MKRIILFLLVIAILLSTNLFAQGFNSVFSKNSTDVIAVGGDMIYRSTDGGQTYSATQTVGNSYFGVWAFGTKIWITNQATSSVYTSTDNGATFNSFSVPGITEILSVCFIDANTGWVSGRYAIYKSTDGGVNWNPETVPAPDRYVSVRFANANNGVACGSGGNLIYTNNGGTTWSSAVNPMGSSAELIGIDIKGTLAIATGADGFILKSTNSGLSWSAIDFKIVTKSQVRGVSIIDVNTFYTCGGGGFVRRSNDGGATYAFQQNPCMAPLSSIYFVDVNNGWAVNSTNRAILRTTDGGTTWAFQTGVTTTFSWVLKQANSSNIGNGFCLNPKNKNVLFVCMGKIVYRSADLGNTWQQVATVNTTYTTAHEFLINSLDTSKWLVAISQTDGASAYRLMKTTDYGVTWTDQLGVFSGTTYGMPVEQDPIHPNTIFLGPESDTLMKSYDWGNTWITNWGGPASAGRIFRSPCDFQMDPQDTNIMYCGDGVTGSGIGIFWKSTNNGQDWTQNHTVTGSEIPMIAGTTLDPNIVYHSTWSAGGFWKSTDRGVSFAQLSGPGGNLWAADIAKDDPTAVSYGTYGTSIYISTNSGSTFTTTTAAGSGWGAGEYFYDKANLLYQQGNGVYKLVINYTIPVGNSQISSQVPVHSGLEQNYPNPFNPSTQIRYSINKSADVTIKVYDIIGSEVSVPVKQHMNAGTYETGFSASELATGVYFYSLYIDGAKADTRKMVIVK